MTAYTDDERRVVPRWRGFHITVQSQELSYENKPNNRHELSDPTDQFNRLKYKWEFLRDSISAFDFVSTATILGKRSYAQEAIDSLKRDIEIPRTYEINNRIKSRCHL